jgi:hypothetical protein
MWQAHSETARVEFRPKLNAKPGTVNCSAEQPVIVQGSERDSVEHSGTLDPRDKALVEAVGHKLEPEEECGEVPLQDAPQERFALEGKGHLERWTGSARSIEDISHR